MYAIIKTGGKQYRVENGAKISVEKLDAELGEAVELEPILVVKDGKTLDVKKAKIRGKVVEHGQGPKLDIFTYKPKKNCRRKLGHRQPFTVLQVEIAA